MSESRIDALAERVLHLEQQNSRLKWFGTASLAALLALVAIGASRGEARRDLAEKVIRAENFVATDQEGRGVVGIGSGIGKDGRGGIQFLDKSGRPRMTLGLEDDGSPFITLTGRDGREQLALEMRTGKGMGISFRDTKQESGLLIGTNPEGVAAIGFMGAGGKLLLDMGVNPDGSSQLTLRDKDGKERLRLPNP